LDTAPDGYVVLEDWFDTCVLRRLASDGSESWRREFANPANPDYIGSAAVAVLSLPDGGHVALCGFPNHELERSEAWVFRVDAGGREVWRRPLNGHAGSAMVLADGSLAVVGHRHRNPADAADPYEGEVGDWALMRIRAADGAVLWIDSRPLAALRQADEDIKNLVALHLLDGDFLWFLDVPAEEGGQRLIAARVGRGGVAWTRQLAGGLGFDLRRPYPAGAALLGDGRVLVAFNVLELDPNAFVGRVFVLAFGKQRPIGRSVAAAVRPPAHMGGRRSKAMYFSFPVPALSRWQQKTRRGPAGSLCGSARLRRS
jgi:hypothetical protein